MKIGIVGLGAFGSFLARQFSLYGVMVAGFDPAGSSKSAGIKLADSLDSLVKSADVLVLAVPAQLYQGVLSDILKADPNLEGKLIVDVASVKVYTERIILDALEGTDGQYAAIHPLFGPESAARGLSGHTIIHCSSNGELADQLLSLLRQAGLVIEDMTADQHDQAMAYAHVLPFVIGRALNNMELAEFEVETPSLKKLAAVAEIDAAHSDQLFETIVCHNPYAKEAISRLKESLGKVSSICPP